MKFKDFILTVTTTIALNLTPAIAGPNHPYYSSEGSIYRDRDWVVELDYSGNTYRYRGVNKRSGSEIVLAGATVSVTGKRKIYTWNNAGTRYRVTWQPQDPETIRLQVISPNGKYIINRLLQHTNS
jgi:hypothetical protein